MNHLDKAKSALEYANGFPVRDAKDMALMAIANALVAIAEREPTLGPIEGESRWHDANGGGECGYVIEDNMNESEGMGDVWFRCTNCNTRFDYYADEWLMEQNYCPHCGFKIRKAVER